MGGQGTGAGRLEHEGKLGRPAAHPTALHLDPVAAGGLHAPEEAGKAASGRERRGRGLGQAVAKGELPKLRHPAGRAGQVGHGGPASVGGIAPRLHDPPPKKRRRATWELSLDAEGNEAMHPGPGFEAVGAVDRGGPLEDGEGTAAGPEFKLPPHHPHLVRGQPARPKTGCLGRAKHGLSRRNRPGKPPPGFAVVVPAGPDRRPGADGVGVGVGVVARLNLGPNRGQDLAPKRHAVHPERSGQGPGGGCVARGL